MHDTGLICVASRGGQHGRGVSRWDSTHACVPRFLLRQVRSSPVRERNGRYLGVLLEARGAAPATVPPSSVLFFLHKQSELTETHVRGEL